MAKKMAIPWELKYKYLQGMLTTLFKSVMYEYREKHGAAAALEFIEGVWKREDRVKNMTKTLKDVFKIEGNDIEAIDKWWGIWWELTGMDATRLEQSKKLMKFKIPAGCAWLTKPKDISDWPLIFMNLIVKAINPKAILERVKGLCAGDPYCEYITKIEE
ncbi:hypothetical protein [Candidatus Borrarchaeum sp.]|uniref:hypothetical protein n=1 Tax=Candidatus Borrarchaeum sp. TaxID=2846742 RepID=UPI0025805F9A|nr:hypothetical protein [Candidatus Borrarchaeum sp.]